MRERLGGSRLDRAIGSHAGGDKKEGKKDGLFLNAAERTGNSGSSAVRDGTLCLVRVLAAVNRVLHAAIHVLVQGSARSRGLPAENA
jgi:hypothetical protein